MNAALTRYPTLRSRREVHYLPPQRTGDDTARQYEAILDMLVSKK